MQAGKAELLKRLNSKLQQWAPLLQRFLKSKDEQASRQAACVLAACAYTLHGHLLIWASGGCTVRLHQQHDLPMTTYTMHAMFNYMPCHGSRTFVLYD